MAKLQIDGIEDNDWRYFKLMCVGADMTVSEALRRLVNKAACHPEQFLTTIRGWEMKDSEVFRKEGR